MKKKLNKNSLSLLICIVLTVVMALFTISCSDKNKESPKILENVEATALGSGSAKFTFTVTDKEGNSAVFEISTDKEIVGDALLELNLISGDEGPYGLYVKTVNGITADYDKDGTYWAFYINGEYAMTGVDSTPIKGNESYSFKIE